jgi:hypothetical protein
MAQKSAEKGASQKMKPKILICLIGALAGIIGGTISHLNYAMTEYYNGLSVFIPSLGCILALVLTGSLKTRPLATLLIFATNLVGFVNFIDGTYLYLADVFYGGVNAQAFMEMDIYFVISFLLLLVGTVCGNIVIYLKD